MFSSLKYSTMFVFRRQYLKFELHLNGNRIWIFHFLNVIRVYVFFWLFWYITRIFFQRIYSELLVYNLFDFQKIGESGKLFVFFLLFKCSDLEAVENFEVFFFFFQICVSFCHGQVAFLWVFIYLFCRMCKHLVVRKVRTCLYFGVNIQLKLGEMHLNYL